MKSVTPGNFLLGILTMVFSVLGYGQDPLLDMESTTSGFLAPRMTEVQRNAMGSLVEGLTVYQIDGSKGYYIYNNSSWEKLVHKESSAVPIGTIIDWWRPNASFAVPEGYAICDGTILSDSESPFDGETLPDLNEVFVRGTTSTANIGQTGGATNHSHLTDPASFSSSTDGSHAHYVDPAAVSTSTDGSHNHSVNPPSTSTSSDGEHNHKWSVFSSSENWSSHDVGGNSIAVINYSDGMDTAGSGTYPFAEDTNETYSRSYYTDNESDHDHTVDIGAFNSATDGSHSHTVNIGSTLSSNSGDHSHTINVPSTASDLVDHIPPYVGLLKIMRVK